MTVDGTGINGTTIRNFPPISSGQVDAQLDQLWLAGPRGEVRNADEPRTGQFRDRMPPVLSAHIDAGARSLHALRHMTQEADDSLIHGAARRAGSRDLDSR